MGPLSYLDDLCVICLLSHLSVYLKEFAEWRQEGSKKLVKTRPMASYSRMFSSSVKSTTGVTRVSEKS